ncbi:nucleoside diphosphate kinase [Streptococcus pneumoniae]|nr:nucleoside diphosphate kinase [Streptococcus pneumoniae]
MEQTFFIIKPDGVKRGLVGEVLKRIEQRGFTIEKLEFRSQVSEELIDQHYQDLVGQSFYLPIREFMTSGPACGCHFWSQSNRNLADHDGCNSSRRSFTRHYSR